MLKTGQLYWRAMEKVSHITKLLDSEQWETWKFQVKLALMSADAWEVVSGSLTETLANKTQFRQADNKAQMIIGTTVGDKQVNHIKYCKGAKAMWDTLVGVHEQKTDAEKGRLNAMFWSYKIAHGESMADAISRLNDIVMRLQNMDEKISESGKMFRLIDALPEEYLSFSAAWDSTAAAEKSFENLRQRLITEEQRRGGGHSSSSPDSEALVMNRRKCSCVCTCNNPVDNPTATANRKPIRCYLCKQEGHIKKDCPNRKFGRSDALLFTSDSGDATKYLGSEALSFVTEGENQSHWTLDSGATDHMSPQRGCFQNYKEFASKKPVGTANGGVEHAHGEGDIEVLAFDGSGWTRRTLMACLYVPKLKFNLFSLTCALDKGCEVRGNKERLSLTRDNETMAIGERHGQLFRMMFENQLDMAVAAVANQKLSLMEWHRRLGHQNNDQVGSVLKKCGISFVGDKSQCESCVRGKAHRIPFAKRENATESIGELVHADVCGPVHVSSIGGRKYFLLIKDAFSHYRHIYFLKTKNEAADRIADYIRMLENQLDLKVKKLRTDNGGEFVNKKVDEYLASKGIIHQKTVRYTPQQNACVEREMRTVMNLVRTMLDSSGLGQEFWAEAANTAVYLLNLAGTSSVPNKSPYELWSGKDIKLDHLQPFGSPVFVHIPNEKRRKLDMKAEKWIFVGYGVDKQGYRCFDPMTRVVMTVRNVTFLKQQAESQIELDNDLQEEEEVRVVLATEPEVKKRKEKNFCDVSASNIIEGRLRLRNRNDTEDESSEDEEFVDANVPAVVALATSSDGEPLTGKDALASSDGEKWKTAMQEELNSLAENDTWTLVERGGQKVLDCKWVFKKKLDEHGNVARYKARLVARGFNQQHGIDYYDTFSPVLRFQSFRMILAVAAARKLKIRFFDVKTAFLNGVLKETVLMKQPDGFEDGTNNVCLLRRSLYGLKQSSRCWNEKFVAVLARFGLVQSENDPCVFVRGGDKSLLLGIYVDDGVIAAKEESEIQELMQFLEKNFAVTESSGQFLGMEVKVDGSGDIVISQKAYAGRIIERYNMTESLPVSIPCDNNRTVVFSDSSTGTNFPYRAAVGSLNYLAVATRPDISYAVGVASRHLENPGPADVRMVKRIIRYIKGTINHGLTYKFGGKLELVSFCDADYGGCEESRRSTSGALFMLAGGAIGWKSKRQRTVALSTCEAEYMAAACAAKELIWMKRLLDEMIGNSNAPILYIDNQSAITLIKNRVVNDRSKHIDIRYHFIRELVERKLIVPEFIGTGMQLADIFTKSLNRELVDKFKIGIGMS